MKVFHCTRCRQVVFFDNTSCVHCGYTLAYVPELGMVAALEPLPSGLWRIARPRAAGRRSYRLCVNYSRESVCNWAVRAVDPVELRQSCRLTQVIPNLSVPGLFGGVTGALGIRAAGAPATALRERLCRLPSLGGLGRKLGPLSAHE
ncbi:MAG TPA: zinc-ribbon domain-containing protein [Steroidobacteraceae bacterium]